MSHFNGSVLEWASFCRLDSKCIVKKWHLAELWNTTLIVPDPLPSTAEDLILLFLFNFVHRITLNQGFFPFVTFTYIPGSNRKGGHSSILSFSILIHHPQVSICSDEVKQKEAAAMEAETDKDLHTTIWTVFSRSQALDGHGYSQRCALMAHFGS